MRVWGPRSGAGEADERALCCNDAEMCLGDWEMHGCGAGEGGQRRRFKMADYPRMLAREVRALRECPIP